MTPPETEPEPSLRQRALWVRHTPQTWEIVCTLLERHLDSEVVEFIRACSPEVVLKLLDRLHDIETANAMADGAKLRMRFSAEDVLRRLEDLEQKMPHVAYVGRVDGLESRVSRLEKRDQVPLVRVDQQDVEISNLRDRLEAYEKTGLTVAASMEKLLTKLCEVQR